MNPERTKDERYYAKRMYDNRDCMISTVPVYRDIEVMNNVTYEITECSGAMWHIPLHEETASTNLLSPDPLG